MYTLLLLSYHDHLIRAYIMAAVQIFKLSDSTGRNASVSHDRNFFLNRLLYVPSVEKNKS